MFQDVIFPGECSVCTREKGEIHCFVVKCVIDMLFHLHMNSFPFEVPNH